MPVVAGEMSDSDAGLNAYIDPSKIQHAATSTDGQLRSCFFSQQQNRLHISMIRVVRKYSKIKGLLPLDAHQAS